MIGDNTSQYYGADWAKAVSTKISDNFNLPHIRDELQRRLNKRFTYLTVLGHDSSMRVEASLVSEKLRCLRKICCHTDPSYSVELELAMAGTLQRRVNSSSRKPL